MSQEKKCVMCAKETANFYIDGENGSVCLACAEKLGKYAKKVKDELSEYDDAVKINLMKPSELMKELNQHIIGQEGAKKAVCTAVYNHYKRVLNKKDSDVEVGKSNILMLGPTASGKTEIARVLARTLGVPFCIVDAQTFTAAGFVGADIQTMITKLYHAADENIKACETGIIFVDEIDKVATRHMGPGLSGRNPGAEGMQQAFLKIVEGTK
jgi:ATP-dependent Clp protease ATP-binding subunit ClpX